MVGEGKERVFAMNRLRNSLRDLPEGTSPADLIDGNGTPHPGHGPAVGSGQEVPPPELIKNAAEEPPTGAGPESFDPDSDDYKAFGWAGNKTLPTLVIILKDGSEFGINYADLATSWPGGSMFLPAAPGCKGHVIRLRIAGDDGMFSVILEGGRLRRVWDLIMMHKTPWIRELPAGQMDFIGGTDPVIRSVSFDRSRAAAGAAGGR